MAGFSPRTVSGHSLYTMRSLLQKAIRRGDLDHAGYAANEMYSNYYEYLWKTLLVVSAEDVSANDKMKENAEEKM